MAISIKPLWIKRGKIDDQLERFTNLHPLEEGTLESLDDFNKRVEEHERQRDILKGQRQQLRDEAKRLGINDVLVRNGQRIDALMEQQDWLQAVQRLAAEHADELKHLEARLASENERLAHEWTGAGKLPPRITSDIVEQLTPQARAIEATAQMVETAKHELELHRTGESEFRSQIESAINSGEKHGLPKDIEAAGDLVTQLRQRLQLEQKIVAAHREAETLEQQAQDLVEEQVVPISMFVFLGTVFVLGAMAAVAWWVVPKTTLGNYGGWIALGGVIAAIAAALVKFLVEASATDRFDSCHYQIESVLDKIEEAEEEQAQLDHTLQLHGGSVALRLQHAERHLAELERLVPVENQHREVVQAASASERRLKQAEDKHTAPSTIGKPASARWDCRTTCRPRTWPRWPANASGWPNSKRRSNIAAMTCSGGNASSPSFRSESSGWLMRPRCAAKRPRRSNSSIICTLNITSTCSASNSDSRSASGRKRCGSRLRSIIMRLSAIAAAAKPSFRKTAWPTNKSSASTRPSSPRPTTCKRNAPPPREITAALGKHGAEADFAPLMAADQIGRLEHDWETLSTQSEELDRHLKELLQRRGAMIEQQRTSASDQSLAIKQMELDVVEEQIKKAVDAWRERAAVSLFLERIRAEYEANRQPETLQEASKYMRQLTDGRYTRIWTPLAHDILFVDTAEGQSLSVQVLSRGTREQLFVSLRLALVAAYARRGIHLPMILDDVFVNFDAGRTRTACAVLRDFAKQGHQLMVFTCHEHVWQMFKDIKVDARRIPNRHGEQDEAVVEPQPEPVPKPVPEPMIVAVEAPQPEPPQPEPELLPPEPVKVKSQRKPPKVEEPEPPVIEQEEIVYEEPVPAAPAPVVQEVEYWWDAAPPNGANGAAHNEEDPTGGWLPEPEIRQRW